MSVSANYLADGVVLTGSQFSEPVRVIGKLAADGEFFSIVVSLRIVHGLYSHAPTVKEAEWN